MTCLGVSEVLDKFSNQPFTCEYKYDGERAQVHVLEGGSVKIYSRNSEDNTVKYPDIAALLPRLLQPGVTSVVLDSEVVAVDRASGKILPFQVTRSGFCLRTVGRGKLCLRKIIRISCTQQNTNRFCRRELART